MYNELDVIFLKEDLPQHSLKKGDIVTVVAVYAAGNLLEIEFIAFSGKTIAIASVEPKQISLLNLNSVISVRGNESAA